MKKISGKLGQSLAIIKVANWRCASANQKASMKKSLNEKFGRLGMDYMIIDPETIEIDVIEHK